MAKYKFYFVLYSFHLAIRNLLLEVSVSTHIVAELLLNCFMSSLLLFISQLSPTLSHNKVVSASQLQNRIITRNNNMLIEILNLYVECECHQLMIVFCLLCNN